MSQQFDTLRSAQKASAETALALMKSSLDTIERLAAINLNTMREALSASAAQSDKLMSAPDLGAALQPDAAQPSLQLTRAYYHRIYDLMTEMQEQLTKVMQAHYSAMSESANAVTEKVAASAPAGGEAYAATMKAMLEASAQSFERLNEMSHQLQGNARELSAAFAKESAKAPASQDKPAGKGKK